MKPTARLRSLLARPGLLVAPGAVDALTARLVQQAGFEACYLTGAGLVNAQFGLPDLGLLSMSEVVTAVERMTAAVDIPVIADADTGYGNPLNVMRTVRAFEHAGAAAIQIEDQVSPKRCGHFSGKEVISAEEMVLKLRAATAARQDPDLVLIARTDAVATHGIAEAIARARAYTGNGADVIFVEAPTEREQMARLAQEIPAPLLINMTEGGHTPFLPNAELERMGFRIAIYPNTLLRTALYAVRQALAILKTTGTSQSLLPQMLSWEERQELVRLAEFQELEQNFVHPPAARSGSR